MSSVPSPTATPFDAAVAEVQAKIEELKTTLATLLRLQADYGGSPSTVSRGGETEISHDSFFNMTIADAVKKYLAMVKVTKSTSDISAGLERGGLKHSSKDFSTTVRSILGQREEFTRVPNGDWGLTVWYPGLGRGRKAKSEKTKKKGRKGGKKGRASKTKVVEPSDAPTEVQQSEEAPRQGTQARIVEYIAKHPNATSREIADDLNLKVQAVTLILGKLKKK